MHELPPQLVLQLRLAGWYPAGQLVPQTLTLDEHELEQPSHTLSHAQALVQLWVMHDPGQPLDEELPALHTPSPPQAPHEFHMQPELQLRERVPQLPQLDISVAPTEQGPSPLHELQEPQPHVELQVRLRVPQSPQLDISVALTAQAPSLPQALHEPHVQLPRQVRVWVPHIPHPAPSIAPGSHSPHATQTPPVQRTVPVQSVSTPHMAPMGQARHSGPPQSTSVSSPPRIPSLQPSVHA